jgi:hypothetical protein
MKMTVKILARNDEIKGDLSGNEIKFYGDYPKPPAYFQASLGGVFSPLY